MSNTYFTMSASNRYKRTYFCSSTILVTSK